LTNDTGCSGASVTVSFAQAPASGVLATIRLQIADEAAIGEKFPLRVENLALDGMASEDAKGDVAEVAVTAPTAFGCFFYMH
jgi:hypothetical protein